MAASKVAPLRNGSITLFELKRERKRKNLSTMAATTITPAKKQINHTLNISYVNSKDKYCNIKK